MCLGDEEVVGWCGGSTKGMAYHLGYVPEIPTMSFRPVIQTAIDNKILCPAWMWSKVPPSATTGYLPSTSDEGYVERGCGDGMIDCPGGRRAGMEVMGIDKGLAKMESMLISTEEIN